MFNLKPLRQFLEAKTFHWLAPWFIRTVSNTWRPVIHQYFDQPELKAALDNNQPMVLAFFHGRMFGILHAHPRHQLAIVVSESRDGQKMVDVGHQLGYQHFVRGSSGRRGRLQAVRDVQEQLTQRPVAAFVDGPRGPGYRVKPGLIRLAAQAQVPIVPVVASARWIWWQFASWDRFVVPAPFTEITIGYGEPLHVPAELAGSHDKAQVSALCQQLEAQMRKLTRKLDRHYGRDGDSSR